MKCNGEELAIVSLHHFNSLKSKKGKPESNKQWTVLACFLKEQNSDVKVVALGTGTSCLGHDQVSKYGNLLHDSHAEIIARRSFNRYLYDQLSKSFSNNDSIFTFNTISKKFQLKEGVRFHFYTTQSPCGDASIYEIEDEACDKPEVNSIKRKTFDPVLTKIKRQKITEDNSPWRFEETDNIDINRTGAKSAPGEKSDKLGSGVDYHEVNLLRTKPGRGVATQSMSCSDKMMKWNIMGCQGGLTSLFLDHPIYISTFIIPEQGRSMSAFQRALFERVPAAAANSLLKTTKFTLNQPQVVGNNVSFSFSNSRVKNFVPCGSSISWCDIDLNNYDVVAKNGLRLGVVKKHRESSKAVSSISRLELFRTFKELFNKLCNQIDLQEKFSSCVTYSDYKNCLEYTRVWKTVRNQLFPHWLRHDEELDGFSL